MPVPHIANRIYQPRTRAESAAPLDAVREACKTDPTYRHAVAVILADSLKPEVTEPAPEDTASRIMAQVRSGGRVAA